MLTIDDCEKICSPKALSALKKNEELGNHILKNFGFLIKEHSFDLTFEGMSRGWAFVFNKDNFSIYLCISMEDKLPLIWISHETKTHYSQLSIEEIAQKLDGKGHLFRYETSAKIDDLNFIKKISFRKKNKSLLEEEYDRKIEETGHFISLNLKTILALIKNLPIENPITTRKL